MKEADLPSPGPGSKSMHLRRIAANMISAQQAIAPKYAGGLHPDATKLRAFFSACADSLIPIDTTPAQENS